MDRNGKGKRKLLLKVIGEIVTASKAVPVCALFQKKNKREKR
jgi:hypothetical protein